MQALIKGETQVDQASRDGSGAVRVRTASLCLMHKSRPLLDNSVLGPFPMSHIRSKNAAAACSLQPAEQVFIITRCTPWGAAENRSQPVLAKPLAVVPRSPRRWLCRTWMPLPSGSTPLSR